MSEHNDIAIIGTGAGGGTLAYALASSGKKILILERGDWLRREKENWDPKAVFVEERYHTTELWYNEHSKPFRPGTNYYVGGNTKVYGASSRFRWRSGCASTRRTRCARSASSATPSTAFLAWSTASMTRSRPASGPSSTCRNALRVGDHLLERL